MRTVLLNSFYTLAFILLLRSSTSLGWRSFKVVFTRFDLDANPKFVDVKAELQNKNNDSTLNMFITSYEILDNIEVKVSAAVETQQGNYSNFISRTVNFCTMMKDPNSDPLIRVLYQDVLRYGNLFKDCPIPKGIYSLQNYHVDEELLPSFLPETKFRFTVQLTKPKSEKIFEGALYGRIDKTKGLNNLKMFSMG